MISRLTVLLGIHRRQNQILVHNHSTEPPSSRRRHLRRCTVKITSNHAYTLVTGSFSTLSTHRTYPFRLDPLGPGRTIRYSRRGQKRLFGSDGVQEVLSRLQLPLVESRKTGRKCAQPGHRTSAQDDASYEGGQSGQNQMTDTLGTGPV